MRYTLTTLIAFSLGLTSLFGNTNSFFNPGMVADTILDIQDTTYLQISDCSALAELCVDIPVSEITNYQILANGLAYNSGIAQCDFDTITRYSYSALFSPSTYILQSWMINGDLYTLPLFSTIDELVTFMNSVDPDGNWVHDLANELIVGGVDSNVYTDMIIFVVSIQTPSVMGVNQTFEANGTVLRFDQGFTEVVIIDNAVGCSDTFYIDVSCVIPDTLILNMFLGDNSVECFDFSELPGTLESVTNVCPGSSGTAAIMNLVNGDSCVVVVASSPGTDVGCFVFCDSLGICDTTTIIANVSIPGGIGTHEYFDTVYNAAGDLLCINTAVLPGIPDTIYNICPSSSNINVSFNIDLMTYCINYEGLANGTDTACIVVCDDMGICDTTNMFITSIINGPDYYYDTIYLNATETYCDFDLSDLPGTVTNMINGCPGNSGEYVDFTVDLASGCVIYNSIDVGKDTACIYISDDMGNVDTTFMIVCSLSPQPETITDTLRLGISETYCIDQSELSGNITDSVFLCGSNAANAVIYDPNNLTLCIDVEAIALGTEMFCVYICDDFMVCDTTYFDITVVEDDVMGLPEAVDDIDVTSLNNEVVTNVCGNDIVPGNALTAFYVLPESDGGLGPQNGAAFVNDDCTIQYEPEDGFCDGTDSYTYVICNSMGCDTANVTITVECPVSELSFYDGFSPNGDGINDFFVIQGIEGYPNSELILFNRWGNQVHKVNNYQNNWFGQWEGIDLPDGVYFYYLEDGEGNEYSGNVTLHR